MNISSEETARFKNVSQALRFIGYDPVIGIEKMEITENEINTAINNYPDKTKLNEKELDELKSLLFKSASIYSDTIIWLSLTEFSFNELNRISLIQLLKYETLLKKLLIIKGINLYLRKNNQTIPHYDA